MDLRAFFQRVYCVSLDRTPERWTAFHERLVACDWPLAPVERFPAIEGRLVKPPPYWQQGESAWGCYRSHASIVEQCLSQGVQSVLLLEDDAVPCDDFAVRVRAFLEAVPQPWHCIYLGGQHLKQFVLPPKRINAEVLQANNVNRTHAWALSRHGMEVVYQHLMARDWNHRHHIDHRLGALYESKTIPVYAPTEWLMSQAEGHSTVCGKWVPARSWNGHAGNIDDRAVDFTVVAVVGPFRSGTSCVAGVLHALGVSVGERLRPADGNNKHGYYEAQLLAQACRSLYRESDMTPTSGAKARIDRLEAWAQRRRSAGTTIGAKHPVLCMMVPEMLAAWPGCRVIAVDRPIEESIASIRRCGWKFPESFAESVTHKLIETRDADIARLNPPLLRLSFRSVRDDPPAAVQQIIDFCGLSPTKEQVAAAIAHVDPSVAGGAS